MGNAAAGPVPGSPSGAAETSPRLPLYDLIRRVLRDNLDAGRLPSGLVVTAASVARAFSVGRAPAAQALRRLRAEGHLIEHAGRGYLIAGGNATAPKRGDLLEAGLVLPRGIGRAVGDRHLRARWYPIVEREVASCLLLGRFQVVETALAERCAVSRTVAHELLTRLERAGLVAQAANRRWYAGPLTAARIRAHYEMRQILEPIALRAAAPLLRPAAVAAIAARLAAAQTRSDPLRPAEIIALERDLHIGLVLQCPNPEMVAAIYRNQLPLITTHYSYPRERHSRTVPDLLAEHGMVVDRLAAGDTDGASQALLHHLVKAMQARLDGLSRATGSRVKVPAYLCPAAER